MILPVPNPLAALYTALSYLPSRERRLERHETAAMFIPVYNEEDEIYGTIQSVFAQTRLPELLVISENGSADTSLLTIRKALDDSGSTLSNTWLHQDVKVLEYETPSVRILVICHTRKTGKAASINFARPLMMGLDRVISIDSDTRLSPRFLELMMGGFYWLVERWDGWEAQYEIHEKAIVCGFVDSRKEPRTGLVGEIFHRARMANQDIGQYLLRVGQNKSAVFVAPGCSYAARVEDFVIPERTVTEDLDFTWKMELRPVERRKLTSAEVDAMGFTIDGMPLGTFLQQNGELKATLVKTRKVYCVRGAIAYSVTPGTLRGWKRQTERWNYGFQQNIVAYNGRLFGNMHLVLVSLGNQIVNIWSCVWLPALAIEMLTHYMSLRTGLLYFAITVGIYLLLLYLAELRKHRAMGRGIITAVGYAGRDTLVNIIPVYICMPMEIYIYIKCVLRGMRDAARGHTGKWDGVWVRPADRTANGTAK